MRTTQTRPAEVHAGRPRHLGEQRRRENGADRLARGLGWFSLGLGIAQIAAPRALARMIGVRDDRERRRTMRAIGAREITTGLGILTRSRPAGWVWARVLGDVMDLAMLGSSMRAQRAARKRLTAATAVVLGVTIADALAGSRLSRLERTGARAGLRAPRERVRQVAEAITIHRTPEELHRFWRDLRNLPRFMTRLVSVELIDDKRSHWTARMPGGATIEWDAEITADHPGELIAWKSLGPSGLWSSGAVRFAPAPGGRGTEIRVSLGTTPRGGVIAGAIARLTGKAAQLQVGADLHRLKQLLETGEVVRSDASVHRGPHPAQPPEEAPAAAAFERQPELGGAQ